MAAKIGSFGARRNRTAALQASLQSAKNIKI
jgi:hypothetical protein